MKRPRQAEEDPTSASPRKIAKSTANVHDDFASSLFKETTREKHRLQYANSEPYKHAVIQPLISDQLLRSVREEVVEHIHFTTKETDIYRIFQSGDLANLDGLPESALARLPSLLRLRDALYSPDFRSWISTVSGAGPVSGKKTDMAINVYKPGCHLLCHDDVIGSRRVSYILYLTDPDTPWKAEWGGALRLYPTEPEVTSDGGDVRVPDPQWSKSIPPAWNQLSFFAVQPGESFHDVEEVYARREGDSQDDGGRVRMAISGWYHIPQEGEEGYEEGLEEKLAERSSLQQLQAKHDSLDQPQPRFSDPPPAEGDPRKADDDDEDDDAELSEADLDFLLKFMKPQYLTPETVEELNELFAEESSVQLADVLSPRILSGLEFEILELEHLDQDDSTWKVATPPHKHRYLFRQPHGKASPSNGDTKKSIMSDLVDNFLPSTSFHKWLGLVTGLTLGATSLLARRFRKGLDYTLATAHEDNEMQLEWCINLTPSTGWTAEEPGQDGAKPANGKPSSGNGHANGSAKKAAGPSTEEEEPSFGGYELIMAADDDEDDDDTGSDHGVSLPANAGQAASSSTGGGHRRVLKSKGMDPAVYKASAEEDDDGILFTNPASWNTMSIVLRDKGTLKFVKYVSKSAPGDRWDISGTVRVLEDDDDENQDDEVDADEVGENEGGDEDGASDEGDDDET